jgi:hypothetical protein
MRSKIIKTSPRNLERPLSFLGGHAEDMEEKYYFKISWKSGFWYTASLEFTKMIPSRFLLGVRHVLLTSFQDVMTMYIRIDKQKQKFLSQLAL